MARVKRPSNDPAILEERRRGFASPRVQPTPKAIYSGEVPRGPIGALRRALLLSLPKWTILGISYISNTALEILCHTELVDRLIATMKLLTFRHMEKYDPRAALRAQAQPPCWPSPAQTRSGGPVTTAGFVVPLVPAHQRPRPGTKHRLRPSRYRNLPWFPLRQILTRILAPTDTQLPPPRPTPTKDVPAPASEVDPAQRSGGSPQ